jgi:hypothetical protein
MMAVGTLNVAVTATTGQAQRELNGLRTTVKGLETTVAGTKRTLGSLSIPEIGRTFYFPKEEMRGALRDTDMFRSKVVDLSQETSRYNRLAQGSTTALGAMRAGLKVATTVAKAGVFVGIIAELSSLAFQLATNEGQWLKWGNTVGRTLGLIAKEGERPDEILGKALDERLKKSNEDIRDREQKRKDLEKEYRDRVREGGLDIASARGLNVDRQLASDVEKFGQTKANQLYEQRQAIVDLENRSIQEKLAKEQQINAMKERQHKYEQQQDKLREKHKRDAETLADLMNEVNDFWLSQDEQTIAKRRRMLDGLADPRMQQQGSAALDRLQQSQFMKQAHENFNDDQKVRLGRSASDTKALDARTSEGWAALRDSLKSGGPQAKLVANTNQQVALQQRTNQILETMIADSGIGFDPFL